MIVQIIEADHPHRLEFGDLTVNERGTVKVHSVFGKDKLKIRLIDCPHGVDECFVDIGGIEISVEGGPCVS